MQEPPAQQASPWQTSSWQQGWPGWPQARQSRTGVSGAWPRQANPVAVQKEGSIGLLASGQQL
jgi:hypothetical protein